VRAEIMEMRRAAALLAAALAVVAGASNAGARGVRAERSLEVAVNSVRAAHGCGPLRLHRGLARAAGGQARLLLADGRLDHDAGTPLMQRLHRAAPGAHLLGEDLAWGAGPRALPRSIVRQWLHSPAHRSVLLDCRFSRLGVGVASGSFRGHMHATVYAADLAA
jgi:uncharacterized protein YkwD